MLKWFSNEEGSAGQGAPGSPQGGVGAVAAGGGGQAAVAELLERLAQTEQLVTQLKELIREKDGVLCTKDEQLKAEKDACEAKLSKLRLQNKAKVTSLTAQLEELKKGGASGAALGDHGTPTHSKKGGADGSEQASRGKILLLRKKVEELEHQLSQRTEELEVKSHELEAQRKRGADMDVMLAERDRKLSEKEAYIVHLQMGLASGDHTAVPPATPDTEQRASPEESGAGALSELQLLVQSLTRKVGESEERYSLLQEQTESLKELLVTEKATYQDKENMYKQNIQTFKDIILQKDNQLMEVSKMHEQELFKLAAKSDASADLEQLLKALKQKLHEKEEVLQGKNQVIDVLQGEVDGRDLQIKELMERAQRLQVERESLGSKMEAEKHVMRAQLRDLLEKHQGELRSAAESHEARLAEHEQALRGQLEQELGRSLAPQTQMQTGTSDPAAPDSQATTQRMTHLEAQAKLKSEEASKSEAKFLKIKAWSKSRIRQLEDELRKSQSGHAGPDVTSLRSRITDLEEEREEVLWKLEQYEELKAKNDVLEAKLVVYEEQQRKMAADLEQVTKRAASQASESGSADDTQSQVLEWQEMVSEAVTARDRAREEKATMALRMSHMEEEREALASRQQELEEELSQARGHTGPHRGSKKLEGAARQHSLQEDFEFDGKQAFHQDRRDGSSESTTPMEEEGENMGGWWPEYTSPDTGGLRSVVEELELERNQLQEQILGLEERCQDLEDRLQLQARIESLQVTFDVDEERRPFWVSQSESERLQGQLSSLRNQQSRDAEKHQLLVTSLNEQLKGLSDTQECLETSLIEKENTLVKTSEKLELIDSLRDSLQEREAQQKEVSDKLLQSEHNLAEVSAKCKIFEKQCSELKTVVADLTQKQSVLKEKTQKQEAMIETLQTDLDQTNDELDKLNTTHLEERAQLIHDLQSCEREIDNLRDTVLDKDKEILALSGNMAEYAEQIMALKQEIKHKEEELVRLETSLTKSEREAQIIRDSQSSDQQALNIKTAELMEQLKYAQTELCMAKEEKEAKMVEVEDLSKQVDADKRTILELRGEIQKQNIDYGNHLKECETQISSLKEQVTVGYQKLHVSEGLASAYSVKLNQFQDKEQACETELKSVKEERNKLLEEVDRHNSELKTLSTRLENQVECQEKLKQEVHEKQKKIYFLEEQLRTTQEEAEAEQRKFYMDLQARDSEKKILAKDLQGESENITKMQNLLKNMNIEKQQLQDDIEKKAEELKSQKQLVEELNEKCTAALELNSSLSSQANSFTEENQRMQQDVAVKDKLLLEMTNDRDSLMNKISFFETQHSDNSKVIEGLLKDKEELTVRVNELNNSLEKNKLSISESLFEKTNECNLLTKTLREKEVAVAHLQDQVDSLNSQLEEVNHNMAEKEKMITDQHSQIEMHRSQLSQLQVTMSLLQEQDSALRAGLTEKDIIFQQKTEECSSLQNKLGQQKKLLSKLQGETKSLKGQCSQLTQNLKEKEENLRQMTQDCEDQKDELNKKNESLKSLSSQLGVINETSAKLESENTELKVSLENHETENNKLRQEMDQRQAEMVVLHNHIQALNEQNQQLRAAYEIREKELAQQIQVASDLDRRVNVTLEENTNLSSLLNSLTEEKNKLQQELNVQSESVSELTKEKNSLQDKLSNFEMKHSESCKMIDGLLKDKKELSVTVDELKTVLVQNTQSISESVLQKTNECSDLTKLLRGSEEALTCSQQQVDSLNIQLNQLNGNMTEKENTIKIQYSQIEAQQSELSNLQETLALLQEQVTTLKSGLTEKDIMVQQKTEECSSLQNKLGQQKKLLSKLQGETKSLKGQCSQLTQRLEEKEENLRQMAQDCENQKDELNKKNESLKSLSSQLGVMNETSAKLESEITELKASHENHETKNIKLRQEMDQRQAEMVVLHNHIQALNEQNQQLRAAYEIREKELAQQIQVASDLDRRVNVTLEENTNLSSLLNSLTEEKNKLQQELNIQSESVSELTKEKNSLQDKLSNFEMKHSENCKMIDGLLKDKKELSVTVDELKTVLVQNTQSISESVLQKTNECSDLTKLLRGSEEALTCSQQQVESLNIQLNQLNGNMSEKENTIKIQNSQIEAQQSELLNLQETLALLQEQVTTLKSGLTEKDMILQQKVEECSSLQIELRQQKTLLSKLRDENESLLGQCSQLTQRLGEKEENLTKMAQELENHKDELDKKNESLKSLGSQLDVVNETHAMLESENTELKTSLETLAADNNKLRQEMDQRHSEVRDLKDNIQALNEQNVRLKSEFRNSVTEASKQLEEISTLKAGILNRDSDVSDLKEQLSTACSEKESLVLSLQQRDKSLKQQEEFIKQLEAQSVEGKGQMSHAITELQTHVQSLQQSLQDKDVSLHESAKQLNLLRDKLTLESEGFKTQLSSNAEAMAELQRDLYNSVEKRNQLNVRMEEQEAVLKQKVDDYVSLRKYVSEMEDSLMQLRSQVSSLTSESSLLKETLKEKDSVFMEAQRSSSAISENLHFQLQAKDTECESLKEQVSHLKESVSKLSGSLIAQSSEMSRLQEAFEEKGTAVMDQSKALQEMERRADEAALFKTQFMESTELVSQLQGQIQELSVKYSSLNQSAEENQSAFVNLQEKYAAHLEELKEAQTLLSQRTEEMLSLNNALGDSKSAVQAAESTILELRNECSSLHQELQQIQALNVDLSKEKEEALATHQRSTSLFTVEIERLKSQYIHVAAQVNALTENLEQREMALHAINSQYTAQVKQTEHLLSEMQKLVRPE
ncbi:COP1-interactive protein 1 isoform X3 [Esox lucius]|uniref:COP1-interactive protein 1 isoform X3 n=1 Tax=Esox lucius TaxID=8010 RepID=UPI001476DF61|nr:COP1-interactive protein 1 isoform X3 [Esox lucius]